MILLSAVTFVGVLKYIGFILVALLCLMFMVCIHELGHFSVGRLLGFKVNEFSIGFGPAIFKRKSKKTDMQFSIRCVPLGGYCAFEGEDEESDNKDAFNKQAPWKRILVLAAGAFFNFISAIILISIFFMAFGDVAPKITEVYELQGASQNFEVGDVILKVEGKTLYSLIDSGDFSKHLNKNDADKTITVLRNGEKIDIVVRKAAYSYEEGNETLNKVGYGVSYGYDYRKLGFFESFGKAFVFIFKVVGQLFATIGKLFTGALGIRGTLGGPVTAITTMAALSQSGFGAIMYGVCVLSATLAIMNILPLPALDGSKIVFTIIEWIRKKPLNRKVENMIHVVGLFVLFGCTILLDILNFI